MRLRVLSKHVVPEFHFRQYLFGAQVSTQVIQLLPCNVAV
jgi:hypothetical protein